MAKQTGLKKRLDKVAQAAYPHISRSKIQELIRQGGVTSNGQVLTDASVLVEESADITVHEEALRYVSRAGLKLEHALRTFNVTVSSKTCLDAGLSTGGFTDCLLHHAAGRVYGIDVGTAQVHPKIATDLRVVAMENTDIRQVALSEPIDLITLDLSFISLAKVVQAVAKLLRPGGELITLIKPQFEVGLEAASKAEGIIKDPKLHEKAIASVTEAFEQAGFERKGIVESPLLGGSGNKEFLAYFVRKI